MFPQYSCVCSTSESAYREYLVAYNNCLRTFGSADLARYGEIRALAGTSSCGAGGARVCGVADGGDGGVAGGREFGGSSGRGGDLGCSSEAVSVRVADSFDRVSPGFVQGTVVDDDGCDDAGVGAGSGDVDAASRGGVGGGAGGAAVVSGVSVDGAERDAAAAFDGIVDRGTDRVDGCADTSLGGGRGGAGFPVEQVRGKHWKKNRRAKERRRRQKQQGVAAADAPCSEVQKSLHERYVAENRLARLKAEAQARSYEDQSMGEAYAAMRRARVHAQTAASRARSEASLSKCSTIDPNSSVSMAEFRSIGKENADLRAQRQALMDKLLQLGEALPFDDSNVDYGLPDEVPMCFDADDWADAAHVHEIVQLRGLI